MKFNVHLVLTVSTSVEVEADSVEEALEKVYDSPDMPGSITYGAFGSASVDEAGEWEPVSVYNADDWSRPAWEVKK